MGLDDYEQVEIRSRAAWRSWLSEHHRRDEGIWLVRHRKHTAHHVSYDDIVEEALCFGWIDILPRKLDADRTQLLLTPRQPGSEWSALNKERVARSMDAGLIEPPGAAVIAAAKADGSWTFLDDVEALVVPDVLAEALAAVAGALEAWRAFPPSSQKGLLGWVKRAKRVGLRANHPEAKGH